MAKRANGNQGMLFETFPMILMVLGSVSEIPGAMESQNGDLVEPALSVYFVGPAGQPCHPDCKVSCYLYDGVLGGVAVPP